MKFRYSMMLVGSLLLSACGGGASPKQEPSLRSQIQVPSDSVQYFYALGEGESVSLAKNSALADIASRISVSVSSSLDNELLVNREDGRESSSQEVRSKVKAVAKTIEFSGVNIEQTRESEGGIEALVKVDRKILFQSYVKKLKHLDSAIVKQMDIIEKSSMFSQLKLSVKVRSDMQKAQEYLLLLEAMKPGFNDLVYRKNYSASEDRLKTIENGAVFSISADKNSAALALLIKEKLSANNIKLSSKKANVKIQLSTKAELKHYKTTNSKIAKMKIVIRTTTIKAVDKSGLVLSNHVIKSKAASSISQEEAISQTKQYEKLIQKNGIIAFLSGNS